MKKTDAQKMTPGSAGHIEATRFARAVVSHGELLLEKQMRLKAIVEISRVLQTTVKKSPARLQEWIDEMMADAQHLKGSRPTTDLNLWRFKKETP